MKKDDRRLSAIVIFRAYFRFHLYPNKTFCFICLGYKQCFDGHLPVQPHFADAFNSIRRRSHCSCYLVLAPCIFTYDADYNVIHDFSRFYSYVV